MIVYLRGRDYLEGVGINEDVFLECAVTPPPLHPCRILGALSRYGAIASELAPLKFTPVSFTLLKVHDW